MSAREKPICIVTEPDWLPKDALQKIEQLFTVKLGPFTTEELKEIAKDAVGYFVGLDHVLNKDLLPDNIQFIASPTTGLNHIDLKVAEQHKINIISLKGQTDFLRTITATSELCWGLILSTMRNIPQASTSVAEGQWDRDRFIAHELQGATIGIIGLGRLGQKIAHYAQAFDMTVLACDPIITDMDQVEFCDLPSLLERSDIVTLHADSKPENHNMIGKEQFSSMKNNAIFINTARGDLVDESALLDALKAQNISAAALDVLVKEFQDDATASDALIQYARNNDNLIITPHIGGVTYESQYKTAHYTIDQLINWWTKKDD